MLHDSTLSLVSLLRDRESDIYREAVWKTSIFVVSCHRAVQLLWHCKWLKACVQLWKILPSDDFWRGYPVTFFARKYRFIKKRLLLCEDVTFARIYNGIISWVNNGISDVATSVSEAVVSPLF